MAGIEAAATGPTAWERRPSDPVGGSSSPVTVSGDLSPSLRAPPAKRAKTEKTYVCSWTECRRAFGKLEHLQRHERSHAGDVRYECPTCRKRFVRRDVMAKHAALHGPAAVSVKRPRKVSCLACASLKTRCEGQPGVVCARCRSYGTQCIYRDPKKSKEIVQSSYNAALTAPTHGETHQGSLLAAGQNPNPSVMTQPALQPEVPPDGSYLTSNPDSSMASIDDFSNLPLDSLYGFMMDSTESYFGWEMDDTEWEHLRSLNTHAPNTPPDAWMSGSSTALSTLSAPPPVQQEDVNIGDAQPADTPWPHVYKPTSGDSRLDLPQVSQKPRPTLHDADLDRVSDSIREGMLALVSVSHQPHWPAVDVASFPSTKTLSVCINLYFRHFHETLPILRRSTFRVSDIPPVLLLSMAAIGAMYSKDGLSELAIALNELARRAIAYLREHDRRAMFDICIVQAWLLQSIFGLFCGSRMLYQHAEISRGGLVTAARRMHLLRPSVSFVEELGRRRETATPEELRRAYAADEERRRLGWGIYMYDAQISCLLNIPPLFCMTDINMPLPVDEEAWNAPTANVETELLQPRSPHFRQVMESLLSTGKLPQPLNPFGFSLIAHTLYRLCTDACDFHSIFSQSSSPADPPYTLSFPANFAHNPQALLNALSASCYTASHMPNALLVSVSALAHLGHLQFTWPGFLDNVKVAAGKSGTETSRREARAWLAACMARDPIAARRILVHAGQLSALLMRFTFDTPSETVWTFDAALTFWALLKFGTCVSPSTSPASSVSQPQKRTSVTWSDFDDVESWVQSGGPATFQGLGDAGELTVARVLGVFGERLENMPWGLAQRFRHVLMSLGKEEDGGFAEGLSER